jgi:anaerobic ribonucleoside-triphosphate reductase
MEEKIFCHDCGKEIEKNEEIMQYEVEGKLFVKCKACHQKDSVLRNFRKTEVYSRVVGYIRPIQQWHQGKQAEFADRKEFNVESSCC